MKNLKISLLVLSVGYMAILLAILFNINVLSKGLNGVKGYIEQEQKACIAFDMFDN